MTNMQQPWPADDLGPLAVHILRLPYGAEAYVVVDNLALGPAIGGTRLSRTVTPAEVARLARAMTIKNAVAGLPHGGGKSGIRYPDHWHRPTASRWFARSRRRSAR